MSYRAWIVAIALGLTCSSLQAQDQANGRQDRASGQEQLSEVDTFSIPVRIIEDNEAAAAAQRSERESVQREKDDLVAQQRMADATEAMNEATHSMRDAAWWSFGAVALGTFLLVWTLFLTRSANKAAQVAVAVTKQIGIDQLRPWMLSSSVDIVQASNVWIDGEQHDHATRVSVKWKNFGHSPAVNSDVYTYAVIIPSNAEIPFFESDRKLGTVPFAHGSEGAGTPRFFGGEDNLKFMEGEADIIIYSRVDYQFSLVADQNAFSEVTYRIHCNGAQQNLKTGEERPNYEITPIGPQNRAT